VHDRRQPAFFPKLAHYFVQRELSMASSAAGACVASATAMSDAKRGGDDPRATAEVDKIEAQKA